MIQQPFTKLKIWQKSIELVDHIYEVTANFPREEMFGLCSQSRRAAVSVPSNIAEGSQRTSDKDFAHFILIAKGSLAELSTLIIIARRRKYLTDTEETGILASMTELDKMLYAFHRKIASANRLPLIAYR